MVAKDANGSVSKASNPLLVSTQKAGLVLNVKTFGATGDNDEITIKSGKDAEGRQIGIPSANITIRNDLMLNGHGGVTIGSEMSGGIYDIVARDLVFNGTQEGIRTKLLRGRGDAIQNRYLLGNKLFIRRAKLHRNTFIGKVSVCSL